MAGRRGGIVVPISTEFNSKGIKEANRQLGAFGKNFGRTFAGIGASLGGALALTSVIDQIKQMTLAAAEDQKSVVALGQALSNLGLGSQTSAMEDYVKATMLATGTSDELIRQGLTRLTAATGDATKSQQLLNLALDISAAGYGDVVSISTALSKAATGNVTALKRLGVPLDANAVKAKDLDAIISSLSSKFRGQAAAAAGTYAGQLQRLNTAVAEAQETIGYELLNSVTRFTDAMGGTNGAVGAISAAGDEMADFIQQATDGIALIGDLAVAAGELAGGAELAGLRTEVWNRSLEALKQTAFEAAGGPLYMLGGAADAIGVTAKEASTYVDRFKYDLQRQGAAARDASEATDDAAASNTSITRTAIQASTAVDRLRGALDKLDGRRSIARQRIQLKRMLAEGPTATGERTVMKDGKEVTERFVTRQDKRLFALDVADARAGLGDSIFQQGMGSNKARAAAARQFALGRRNIRGLGFGSDVAQDYLATPNELMMTRGQSAASLRYQGAGTMIVVEKVEVTGDTPAQVVEKTQQWVRLKALGAGRGAGQVPKAAYS